MKKIEEIHIDNLDRLVSETPKKTLDNVAEIASCSAAYLSQIRNRLPDSKTGTPKTMGKVIARRLEKGFKKPDGWMDTDHDEQKIEGEFSLVQMMDLKLSGGAGNLVFEFDGTRKIAFRTEYLKKRGIKIDQVLGFPVDGESMVDAGIPNGSMVAVNRSITEPKNKKYYAMWIDGEYLVKEIVKMSDGFYAISHNAAQKNKYPDRLIDSENSGIIGQVFYCGFEL